MKENVSGCSFLNTVYNFLFAFHCSKAYLCLYLTPFPKYREIFVENHDFTSRQYLKLMLWVAHQNFVISSVRPCEKTEIMGLPGGTKGLRWYD